MEVPLDKKLRRKIDDLLRSNIHAKVQKRLFALRWMDEGKSIEQIADLLAVTTRTVRDWLSILRNKGLDELLVLQYKGDAGNLSISQTSQLKAEIETGKFHCARQIQAYLLDTFQVAYSLSGVKRLLHRIGCSYHQISGFLFKADEEKQKAFVKDYEADRPKPGEKKDATSSTPAIRSGVWRPSFPAGCVADNASTSA
jgi:transposase